MYNIWDVVQYFYELLSKVQYFYDAFVQSIFKYISFAVMPPEFFLNNHI